MYGCTCTTKNIAVLALQYIITEEHVNLMPAHTLCNADWWHKLCFNLPQIWH